MLVNEILGSVLLALADIEGEEESQHGELLSNPTAFQSAISQAVTEISTGFLNAMGKVGKRTQAPNTPRRSAEQHSEQEHADSKLQSSKELLRKQFTYDFEAGEAATRTAMDAAGSIESSAPVLSNDPGVLASNDDDVNLNIPSEFQAFVAASAADASLFSFGDDEGDDSDDE